LPAKPQLLVQAVGPCRANAWCAHTIIRQRKSKPLRFIFLSSKTRYFLTTLRLENSEVKNFKSF